MFQRQPAEGDIRELLEELIGPKVDVESFHLEREGLAKKARLGAPITYRKTLLMIDVNVHAGDSFTQDEILKFADLLSSSPLGAFANISHLKIPTEVGDEEVELLGAASISVNILLVGQMSHEVAFKTSALEVTKSDKAARDLDHMASPLLTIEVARTGDDFDTQDINYSFTAFIGDHTDVGSGNLVEFIPFLLHCVSRALPDSIDLQISAPIDLSDNQIKSVIRKHVLYLNDLHRALGGSGLKVDRIEAEVPKTAPVHAL